MRHSYSSVKLFERCPKAWEYSYVQGIKGKVGAAAERGTRIHFAAERFFEGEITASQLPVEYKPFLSSMELAKTLGARTEYRMFINQAWRPLVIVDENKEPEGAWALAIIDLHYTVGDELYIVDLKTGQFQREHEDQVEFYMVVAATHYPNIERVHGCCFYLDQGTVGHQLSHRPSWLAMLRIKWASRIALVEKAKAAGMFPTTPGPRSCGICSYRASRGGPCEKEYVHVQE